MWGSSWLTFPKEDTGKNVHLQKGSQDTPLHTESEGEDGKSGKPPIASLGPITWLFSTCTTIAKASLEICILSRPVIFQPALKKT